MKLYEILDDEYDDGYDDYRKKIKKSAPFIDIPYRASRRDSINHAHQNMPDKYKMLGSGAQAVAYTHPKDPTKIVKYVKLDKRNPQGDSHVRWINMVKQHQNNPFFPRIFNTKIIKTDNGGNVLVVVMERLHDLVLNTKSGEGNRLQDAMTSMMRRLGVRADDPVTSVFSFDTYMSEAENRKELAEKTKNPMLKQALELMEPMFMKYGSDLHNENFMARLTGSGPQLVFLDPFSPNADSQDLFR